MLNYRPLASKMPVRRGQRGLVLIFALIVLVAMTLAGLALVRSVDTTILITGNMAFQQAATQSGDQGIEQAVTWLQNNNIGTTLHSDIPASGYFARRQDPVPNQTWDSFWNATLSGSAQALPQDAAGNQVSYVIQRLCAVIGDPTAIGAGCAVPQTGGTSSGSSKGAGVVALLYNSQVYYRVTARISGPRNTVSYVQAVIAL